MLTVQLMKLRSARKELELGIYWIRILTIRLELDNDGYQIVT